MSRRTNAEPTTARARAEQTRADIVAILIAAGPKTATELLADLPRHGTSLVYEDIYRSLRVLENRNQVTRYRTGRSRTIRWQPASHVTRTTP